MKLIVKVNKGRLEWKTSGGGRCIIYYDEKKDVLRGTYQRGDVINYIVYTRRAL